MSQAYSYQLCDVCDPVCDDCCADRPDSQLVVWGICQDLSSPQKLRPSTCLHFRGS
jgi:hypothetical protein